MCLQQPSYDWTDHTLYTIKTLGKQLGQLLEMLDENVGNLPEGFYLNRMNWCKKGYDLLEQEKPEVVARACNMIAALAAASPVEHPDLHKDKAILGKHLARIEERYNNNFQSLIENVGVIKSTIKMIKWGQKHPGYTDEEAINFITTELGPGPATVGDDMEGRRMWSDAVVDKLLGDSKKTLPDGTYAIAPGMNWFVGSAKDAPGHPIGRDHPY